MKRKKLLVMVGVALLLMVLPGEMLAQCAMCKTAAESSLESGSSAAAGINKGVLYLFLTPYLVGGVIGFFWWRAKRKAEA